MTTATAGADVGVVVPQALFVQSITYPDRSQQVGRELLKYAGAHAIDHVFAIAPFENHGIDSLKCRN